jgi:hypothetical protein
MTQFNIGDRVRFFQDLSEYYGIGSPEGVSVGAIGYVDSTRFYGAETEFKVNFEEDSIWFMANELELVDEEVDLPFNPISGITLTNVLDVSLEANQRLYLSALSGMVTARKQMADLTLDRYLPEAVRDSLEDHLSKQLSEFGEQAEDAVKRMSKILEVK